MDKMTKQKQRKLRKREVSVTRKELEEDKVKWIKWTIFYFLVGLIFAIALIISMIWSENYKQENTQLKEQCGINQTVIIKYFLNDGEHTTTYFTNNHSYTIDYLFTCNGFTYYSTYEYYLQNCEVLYG